MLSSSTLCSKAPVFVLSFKMSRYWCHSFFVLQSVKQRRRTAMKKNRLKSFSFSFVLFVHTKASASHNHIFSFHLLSFFHYFFIYLFFILAFSHSCHIKVKRDLGLLSEYQMLVGLKYATKGTKLCFWICCKWFVFLLIKTNPWLVAGKRHRFIRYILCHDALCAKVRAKL